MALWGLVWLLLQLFVVVVVWGLVALWVGCSCFLVCFCFLVVGCCCACPGLLVGVCVVVACGWFVLFLVFFGEFDPGSGRTLAACLTHASRTGLSWFLLGWVSGERVSNT